MNKMQDYGFFIDKFYKLDKPTEKFILDNKIDYKTSRIVMNTTRNQVNTTRPKYDYRKKETVFTSAELDMYAYVSSTDIHDNELRVVEMMDYLEEKDVKEIPDMFLNNMCSVVYEIYDDKNTLIASGEHASQATSRLGIKLNDINEDEDNIYNNNLLYSSNITLDIPKSEAYNISDTSVNTSYVLRITKIKVYNTTRDGNTMRDIYITQPNLAGSFNNATFSTYNSSSKPFEIKNSNFISNVVAEKTLIDQILVPAEFNAPPIEQDVLIVETDDAFSYTTRLDPDVTKININMEIMANVITSVYDNTKIQDILDINNGLAVVTYINIAPHDIFIERGREYRLAVNVLGFNLIEPAVALLNLVGTTSKQTYIDDKYILHVGMDETCEILTIESLCEQDPDKQFVKGYRVIDYVSVPEVKIIPREAIIRKGETLQFTTETILVPDGTVQEFSITGNNSTNTFIDINGLLKVADDETSTRISVTVNIPLFSISDISELKVEYPLENPAIYITPEYVTVPVGRTYQFIIDKYNIPDDKIISCSVGGKKSPNTTITNDGLLTIAEDETSHSLVAIVNVEGLNIGDSSAILIDHEAFIEHIEAIPPAVSLRPGTETTIEFKAEALTSYQRINVVLAGQTSTETRIENVYNSVDNPSHIEYDSHVTTKLIVGVDEMAEVLVLSATIPELGLLTQVNAIVEHPKMIINPDRYNAVKGEMVTFTTTFENVDDEYKSLVRYSIMSTHPSPTTNITDSGVLMISTTAFIGSVITVTASIDELGISSTSLITIVENPTIILLPKDVLLHPGDTQQFTISSTGVTSDIDLYIGENTSPNTYIDNMKVLHIGLDETSDKIRVIADSDMSYVIPDIVTVNIEYIPEIKLSPIVETIIPDAQLEFTVETKNIPDENELTYIVENNTSLDTTFIDNILTVGVDETSMELILYVEDITTMTRSNVAKITVMY